MIAELSALDLTWALAAATFGWLGSAVYRSIRDVIRASHAEETA
jgi:hypothetical protein